MIAKHSTGAALIISMQTHGTQTLTKTSDLNVSLLFLRWVQTIWPFDIKHNGKAKAALQNIYFSSLYQNKKIRVNVSVRFLKKCFIRTSFEKSKEFCRGNILNYSNKSKTLLFLLSSTTLIITVNST